MMVNSRAALGVAIKAAGIVTLVLIAALAWAQPALAQPGPVVFPPGDWPWYAQEEIAVHPEPPVEGHLTELCATVINEDLVDAHPATLEFGIQVFGIGLPFDPVGQVDLEVPPGGEATGCVVWVPPEPGPWCVEVLLTQPGVPEPQRSLRNVDVDEPLVPGEPHTLFFPVLNPFVQISDVNLELTTHLAGWNPVLSETILPGMIPHEVRYVSLTVTPPAQLPPGLTPIVDVEAFVDTEPIGGFRKFFRPPVLLHRFPDPPYAEREISVHPYPTLAGEPVEVCVELRNPTAVPQDVEVQFSWANFGIGLPFTPINGLRPVHLPPHSVVNECIHWIPPVDGHVCLQVELFIEGYEPQRSQRNFDVNEPLEPGQPHELVFPVRNPTPDPKTIFLRLIPHLDGWGLELAPGQLNLFAGETGDATLTVTPPQGYPLPEDGTPIVDVEAYWQDGAEDVLIGGFRKIFRPPVPIHRPGEPTYGESEISIEPYPPRAGEPVAICTRIRNYADVAQTVQVEFSTAGFGIGIPFMPIAPPMMVEVPAESEEEVCVNYVFSYGGQFCVQVRIQAEGYPEVFSQRNFDVIEILRPGEPDVFQVPVGNPFPAPVDITLGLINHTGWEVRISPEVIPYAPPWPEPPTPVTIWLTPTAGVLDLPEYAPVIDLEAYANNELIGGIRKVFRPPIQLHPFPDPPYAEREITVHPYPPLAGEPVEICVELRNPTGDPWDVAVQFSWANFGIGLPFTPINGLRPVHLPPHSVVNECIHWIPPVDGHVCLQVELFIEGYEPQRSQRNIDVDEPLVPGLPHELIFPVGNPLGHVATIELGLVPHLDGWDLVLVPEVLPDMAPGEVQPVSLIVTPPGGEPLPEDGRLIVDVEAFADGELIGGFRKIHRPPIQLHPFPDPPYAEREITVHPYPPLAGEPVEICVELRNPTPFRQDVAVQFSWANFGIGLPFTPINGLRPVHLPPYSVVNECIWWIPPVDGHVCLQVELFIDGYEPQRSQRNIDVDEPLVPGEEHTLIFPVGNPLDHVVTIELGSVPHIDGWDLVLTPPVLPDMQPGEVRDVSLAVTPPAGEPLPQDGHLVVDVEAFAEGELIGGFRKIHRPPIQLHPFPDPPYAEREITVHPYPPRAGEPTEVCVELRNPTPFPHDVQVQFSWANFGIGLPFTPINGLLPVHLPPHSLVRECIHWIPPVGGHVCLQVELFMGGYEPQRSQLNIDVDEPLEPGQSHTLIFPVGNPLEQTATIELGLVPHLDGWDLDLSPHVLPDVQPGEVVDVALMVTPPDGEPLPEDGHPIVDVEAFVEGELIGGFRKIYRPPVPVHRPKDPVYAESEIGVDPYPVLPGQPVQLSVEVFNPTDTDRIVTASFSIAPFGIGLPFSSAHITPNPIQIFVPRHGAARGHVIWEPPDFGGKFCVRVELQMEGHEPMWSQRNIDVGEPLEPGQPHDLVFPVGTWPYTQPVSITLGLVKHRDGWDVSLSEDELTNAQPGQPVDVTLTVSPTGDAILGTGEPIVDVEAFVEGELLGGFRKLDIPPMPLHKPHEKVYAETELSIEPDPPRLGQEAKVSAVLQNNAPTLSEATVEFGWAKFGVGIPFTTTNMVPFTRTVQAAPGMTVTASVTWTPVFSGSHCVMVKLIDPDGDYEDLVSQRNVEVVERPPCGATNTHTFTVYNDQTYTVTVDIGMITFDVPADWQVSTEPSATLELGPQSEGTISVTVNIPCPITSQALLAYQELAVLQQGAGGVPTIDVEGYVDGELVGGIELQFPLRDLYLYLPLILKR